VVRELREETGLRAACGDLVGWAEVITGEAHYVILDFRVDLLDPPEAAVAGDDAVALAWVPLGEVAGHDLVPGLAEFLSRHGVIPPSPAGGISASPA
jgi:8-oxo-dGTP pyrophosphatase MutT (NUDIX family)